MVLAWKNTKLLHIKQDTALQKLHFGPGLPID